jgi:NAD(P)-dependent dehydrogenase (short-subunit alcohol dehydrogenase family)
MDVKDKVAVVTGGAQGIGLALCTRFAREGAHVVLSDLSQEACEREAAPIGALPVAADVGREEDIANLVSAYAARSSPASSDATFSRCARARSCAASGSATASVTRAYRQAQRPRDARDPALGTRPRRGPGSHDRRRAAVHYARAPAPRRPLRQDRR